VYGIGFWNLVPQRVHVDDESFYKYPRRHAGFRTSCLARAWSVKLADIVVASSNIQLARQPVTNFLLDKFLESYHSMVPRYAACLRPRLRAILRAQGIIRSKVHNLRVQSLASLEGCLIDFSLKATCMPSSRTQIRITRFFLLHFGKMITVRIFQSHTSISNLMSSDTQYNFSVAAGIFVRKFAVCQVFKLLCQILLATVLWIFQLLDILEDNDVHPPACP
jgi:hypothetical protein